MCLTCSLTVPSEMNSRDAMAALVRPRATNSSTSHSRSVKRPRTERAARLLAGSRVCRGSGASTTNFASPSCVPPRGTSRTPTSVERPLSRGRRSLLANYRSNFTAAIRTQSSSNAARKSSLRRTSFTLCRRRAASAAPARGAGRQLVIVARKSIPSPFPVPLISRLAYFRIWERRR